MTTHSEVKPMPYTADQMFELVSDVKRYPEFIPWVAAMRIRQEREIEGGSVVDADTIVSFKVFRESFLSRVTLKPEARTIDVEYLDGPFKYLINNWRFEETETGCNVHFHVDFEFKSRILQAAIGAVFNEAMRRIVGAFEARARALYG
ncbi:type II toxin-antitoxin system RatA family toxin [Pontivivens insulae]|uniref:Persistence and stress-resistance toxin PasT n=1 Tax=Pontivivens insulae TaxID=1639689 RepID=A0A2R8A9N0_9RHOB|nr:type II toxin-antitoxin system RatA family toxin [Pontivivens insulae]RED12843.1 coenzyme Q-binding protein COQ10 [Pontivivens insulae]SPF28934.1 Persistence and stress-resistance toxin PasT [Pontivivens insulae]